MQTDILSHIRQIYPGLSKGQKKIADFILSSYEKAAFMTAKKLSQAVGTSESTVVRFACILGFSNYGSLQSALKATARALLTAPKRMEITSSRADTQDAIIDVMTGDLENIRDTIGSIDKSQFDAAVDALHTSRKIFLLGVRSCGALASFAHFYLRILFDHVQLLQLSSTTEVLEQMLRIGPDDILLAISFPRYSSATVSAVQFAKSRGAKVLAITDTPLSPIATEADFVLTAPCDTVSIVDSLVAPLSLINALIVASAMKNKQNVYKTLEDLEQLWDQYQIYEK